MRILMKYYVGVECGMTTGATHQAHVHQWPLAIHGSDHVSGPVNRAGVSAREYRIPWSALGCKVNGLKITGLFIESQHIVEVMHVVAKVEDVQNLLLVAHRVSRVELYVSCRRNNPRENV